MSGINSVKAMWVLGGRNHRINKENPLEKPAYEIMRENDKNNDGNIAIIEFQEYLSEHYPGIAEKYNVRSFHAIGIDRMINADQKPENNFLQLRFCFADIASVGDSSAVPFIAKFLKHPNELVRREAAVAIAILSDRGFDARRAVPKLMDAASNPNESIQVRVYCIESLGKISGPAVFNFLRKIVEDDNENNAIRGRAARAIANTGDLRAFDVVNRLYKDSTNIDVHADCMYAFGKTGDPRSMEIFIEVISDKSADFQVQIAAFAGMEDLVEGGRLSETQIARLGEFLNNFTSSSENFYLQELAGDVLRLLT